MNIFKNTNDKIMAVFSDWIKVKDPKSIQTIEDFSYESGVDEKITNPHCWKCVTVNQYFFKNEWNKKPRIFDYNKNSTEKVNYDNFGLYHPNCHCYEIPITTPNKFNYCFENLIGKIDFFFKSKLNWYYSWGYKDEDKEFFINKVLSLTYESYVKGNYENTAHDKQGFRINVFIDLPGKNEKLNHIYKVKTCWMIFPNGKLKCNTLIGGRTK